MAFVCVFRKIFCFVDLVRRFRVSVPVLQVSFALAVLFWLVLGFLMICFDIVGSHSNLCFYSLIYVLFSDKVSRSFLSFSFLSFSFLCVSYFYVHDLSSEFKRFPC